MPGKRKEASAERLLRLAAGAVFYGAEEGGARMRFSWLFEVSSAKLAHLPAGCGECVSVSGEVPNGFSFFCMRCKVR